jgi:hypothetical protein
MASSPWGTIQHSTQIAPGLRLVSTASHGGLLLTGKAATRLQISPAALALGSFGGTDYGFEEDIDWAILAWEIPQLWDRLFAHAGADIRGDPRTYLWTALSAYRPDFLRCHGVEPEPEAYARYLAWRRADQMRADRHPDHIVSARGDWAEGCPPGAVEVTTADGKVQYVTAESYDASRCPLNLLSKCLHYPVRDAAP